MDEGLGTWEPLPPRELPAVLRDVRCAWWLAGGWAVDSFLGTQTRAHGDTDVLVLRDHHVDVRAALSDWDAHAADPPGTLRPWPVGEVLPDAVHDVWLRRAPGEPWAFQLMIDDTEGGDWVFRRDRGVRRPVASLTAEGAGSFACPVLAVEVQLLYKAKGVRPKDQADFDAAVARLSDAQASWLRTSLARQDPHHPWLEALVACRDEPRL